MFSTRPEHLTGYCHPIRCLGLFLRITAFVVAVFASNTSAISKISGSMDLAKGLEDASIGGADPVDFLGAYFAFPIKAVGPLVTGDFNGRWDPRCFGRGSLCGGPRQYQGASWRGLRHLWVH